MRIISNFRDYYDGVQQHGQDRELVYARRTEVLEKHDLDLRSVVQKRPCSMEVDLRQTSRSLYRGIAPYGVEKDVKLSVVGFCGRLYFSLTFLDQTCWSTEQVERAIRDYQGPASKYDSPEVYARVRKAMLEAWVKPNPCSEKRKDEYHGRPLSLETATDFFQANQGQRVPDDVFLSLGAPAFRVGETRAGSSVSRYFYKPGEDKLELNPRLQEHGFQAVVEPFAAFQELSMYLGSVFASQQKPPVEVSDATRIAKAGFDKISFRNIAPGPRKARRAAR